MVSHQKLASFLGTYQSKVTRNLNKQTRSLDFCRLVEKKASIPWKEALDMPTADLRAALEAAYAAAHPAQAEAPRD